MHVMQKLCMNFKIFFTKIYHLIPFFMTFLKYLYYSFFVNEVAKLEGVTDIVQDAQARKGQSQDLKSNLFDPELVLFFFLNN